MTSAATPAAGPARGVLAIWTDIAPELEADFNEWYWREHLPERLAVPGFRRCRRYRAPAGAPRYFACYDLDALEILASPAYLARLDDPSAWTRRVMPGFRNTTRATFDLAATVGAVEGAQVLTVRLSPCPDRSAALDAALGAMLPALQAHPGITRAQHWRGRTVDAAPTREAALRGNADAASDGALIVEAAEAEDLAAVEREITGAPALAQACAAPPLVARYRLLCSLGGEA